MSLHRGTLDLIYELRAVNRRPCVHRCGELARHGRIHCQRCAAYHKLASADHREKCHALGRCERCPAPAVTEKTCCRPCLDRLAEQARRRYRQAAARRAR